MLTTCSSTHKNKKIAGLVILCIGLLIAIKVCTLYRSGDIETNPGPKCEHIVFPHTIRSIDNYNCVREVREEG